MFARGIAAVAQHIGCAQNALVDVVGDLLDPAARTLELDPHFI